MTLTLVQAGKPDKDFFINEGKISKKPDIDISVDFLRKSLERPGWILVAFTHIPNISLRAFWLPETGPRWFFSSHDMHILINHLCGKDDIVPELKKQNPDYRLLSAKGTRELLLFGTYCVFTRIFFPELLETGPDIRHGCIARRDEYLKSPTVSLLRP